MLSLQQATTDHSIGRWLAQLVSEDIWQQTIKQVQEKTKLFRSPFVTKNITLCSNKIITKWVNRQIFNVTSAIFMEISIYICERKASPHFFLYGFFTMCKTCCTALIINLNWLHPRKIDKRNVCVCVWFILLFL